MDIWEISSGLGASISSKSTTFINQGLIYNWYQDEGFSLNVHVLQLITIDINQAWFLDELDE